MTKVFISYSRKDLSFVEKLASDLEDADVSAWYDLSRLQGGDRWAKELEAAIDSCDVFMLVISPDSIKSQWVSKEFLYASSNDKKIVPLLYKPCKLPLWLQDIHFIDIQGEKYQQNFHQVLRTLGIEQPSTFVQPPSQPKTLRTEFVLVLVSALVVALIGAIATISAGILAPPLFEKWVKTTTEPTETVVFTPDRTGEMAEPCYDAVYVQDVTVQDWTEMAYNQNFEKVWLIRNSGTCTWGADYHLIFSFGDRMSGQTRPLSSIISPGDTVEVSVAFTAPITDGEYTSSWQMAKADGAYFGDFFTVAIIVR